MYVSPETIEKARKIDLFSYLKACEPYELVYNGGGEYSTKTHDSLKISNGKWYWWSRGFGGKTALDYLVKVREIEFTRAVEMLTGTVEIPSFSYPQTERKAKKFDRVKMPLYDFKCKNAREYLISRGISERVIDDCIARKLIAESREDGSVLFLGYDENGKLKHCSARATDGTSRKKDMYGSDKRYTFKLMGDDARERVLVFEGVVDLLSYATLLEGMGGDYKRENMLSLSGIYLPKDEIEETKVPMPLEYFLEKNPHVKRVHLHLDNDFAGQRGANAMQVVLGERYDVRYLPPPKGKDYNDYLILQKQRKVRNKNENRRKDEAR